jgi:hypothetical protein
VYRYPPKQHTYAQNSTVINFNRKNWYKYYKFTTEKTTLIYLTLNLTFMKKCSFILAIIMLAFSNITLSQATVNITAPTAGYNWIATVTPTLVINFNISTGVGGAATVNINVNPNVQNIIINNTCTLPGNMVVNFIAATSISGSITMTNAAQALSNLTVKGPGNIVIGGNLTINSPGNNVNNTCEFANTTFTNILGNVVLGSAAPLPTDGSSVIGKGTVTGTAIRTFNLYGNLTINTRGSISYERTIFNFNKPSGPPQFVYNNTPIVSTYRYPVTFEDIRVGTANAQATANAANLIFSGTNKNAYLENITTTTAKGITIGTGATLDLPRDYSLNTLNSSTQKINLTMEAASKLRIGGDQTDPSSAAGGIVGSNFPNIFDKDLGARKGTYNLNPSSTIEYYGSSAITQTIYSLPYDLLTTLPSNTQYANLLANNDGGTGTGRAKKITTNRIIVDTRLDIKTNTDVTLGIANNLNDCPLYTVGPIKVQGGSGPTGTNGGGLYCNANVVSGNFTLANMITTGTFSLDDFAYLGMGHALGISAAGTASGNIQMLTGPMAPDVDFNTKGNYTYNGTVTQITGPNLTTGLPTTVNDLKIDNPTTVTIDRDEIVNGVCLLAQGVFDIGTTKITSNGIGVLNSTGGKMKADAVVFAAAPNNQVPIASATLEMKGNATTAFGIGIPQNLSSDWFVGNKIATLINNNTAGNTVPWRGIAIAPSPANPLLISTSLEYGKDASGIYITGSTINTNDNLTLLSKPNALGTGFPEVAGTANFGNATGNFIDGRVSIERYLNTARSWRFLATPVQLLADDASTPTIAASWREGQSPLVSPLPTSIGYGTQITGPSGPTLASPLGELDAYTQRGSMKYYNDVANVWVELSNTTATRIANEKGYAVFVVGDRGVPNIPGTPTTPPPSGPTILRIKGKIRTGDQLFNISGITIPSTNKSQSIGNPYPARINFSTIQKTNVVNGFTVWNPNLGGLYGVGAYQQYSYVTAGAQSGYYLNGIITPGASPRYIESGEAFFIHNNISAPGSATITESCKTPGSSVQSRPILVPALPRVEIAMHLNYVNGAALEPAGSVGALTKYISGASVTFGDNFSNDIDNDDFYAWSVPHSNLTIRSISNVLLRSESRPFIAGEQYPIKLNISAMIPAVTFPNSNANTVGGYSFDINITNMSSMYVTAILKDNYLNTRTPLDLSTITSYRFETLLSDPLSYAADRFAIVFSQFALGGRMSIGNAAIETNSVVPSVPSQNNNGTNKTNEAIVQTISETATSVSIAPNPIQNGIVNLQLQNQKEGIYQVQITNQLGQVIKTQTIKVQNKKSLYTINLGTTGKGTYQASIVDEAGNKKVIGFVVN